MGQQRIDLVFPETGGVHADAAQEPDVLSEASVSSKSKIRAMTSDMDMCEGDSRHFA